MRFTSDQTIPRVMAKRAEISFSVDRMSSNGRRLARAVRVARSGKPEFIFRLRRASVRRRVRGADELSAVPPPSRPSASAARRNNKLDRGRRARETRRPRVRARFRFHLLAPRVAAAAAVIENGRNARADRKPVTFAGRGGKVHRVTLAPRDTMILKTRSPLAPRRFYAALSPRRFLAAATRDSILCAARARMMDRLMGQDSTVRFALRGGTARHVENGANVGSPTSNAPKPMYTRI